MNRILLIAHAPLAQALRQCALHVFPECDDVMAALDVQPHAAPADTLAAARRTLAPWQRTPELRLLVLADLFGATPCNVAQQLVAGTSARLVAGVNLPMLLRALCYRHEPFEGWVQRALAGGLAGVMAVGTAAAADPPSSGEKETS